MPKIAATLTVKQIADMCKNGVVDDKGIVHKEGTWPISPRLYLQSANGNASVLFRYKSPLTGKGRSMGLGSYDPSLINAGDVLATHRAKVATLAAQVKEGTDPLDDAAQERKTQAARAVAQAAAAVTFRELAVSGVPENKIAGIQAVASFIDQHGSAWSAKHRGQFLFTLDAYACPAFGDKAIGEVTKEDVAAALSSIWADKHVTAKRLRNRIEQIFDYAIAKNLYVGSNPAKRGVLKHLLDKSVAHKVKPHRALPYDQLPNLVDKLAARNLTRSRALEFAILTTARTATVRFATWGEINGATWTVPGERMLKNDLPWRCPLSPAALALLAKIMPTDAMPSDYIFPGQQAGRPMAHDQLDKELKALDCTDTVHGTIRSGFSSWCADHEVEAETREFQLAHVEGSATVKAYQRSDKLELRRPVMVAWAAFCLGEAPAEQIEPSNIVRLHRAG